jgi:ADP-ribose pyrophosphatase
VSRRKPRASIKQVTPLYSGFLKVNRYELDVEKHEGFLDNLVAGGIGEGESIVDAAVREMKEETGLDLRAPFIVHPGAYVSSGGTSERIAIVFGFVDTTDAGGVHGNPHESEDILTVVLPSEEFVQRVRRNELSDMKTVLAGYWFAEYLRRRRGQTSL